MKIVWKKADLTGLRFRDFSHTGWMLYRPAMWPVIDYTPQGQLILQTVMQIMNDKLGTSAIRILTTL